MKVEFLNYVLGDVLFIKASEFFKASDDGNEFDSMNSAIYAFYSTFCFAFSLDLETYEEICKNLNKSGVVIFAVGRNEKEYYKYPEIYVSNHNKLKLIISDYEEEM